MLKEIYEHKGDYNTFRGRLLSDYQKSSFLALRSIKRCFKKQNASSLLPAEPWHAGLVGEYLFEDAARIPVEVEYASEFRYRNPVIGSDDVVIAISQSGETADTLAAIALPKKQALLFLGFARWKSIARVPIPELYSCRPRNWSGIHKSLHNTNYSTYAYWTKTWTT